MLVFSKTDQRSERVFERILMGHLPTSFVEYSFTLEGEHRPHGPIGFDYVIGYELEFLRNVKNDLRRIREDTTNGQGGHETIYTLSSSQDR